jgi:hypothetical protein
VWSGVPTHRPVPSHASSVVQAKTIATPGPFGLVADDALAGAGADALLARLASWGCGELGGAGAWLAGAVAGAPPGAALAGLGTPRPGVAAAMTGGVDLVAGHRPRLGSQPLVGRINPLLVPWLRLLRRVAIPSRACATILPGVFVVIGLRTAGLLAGSLPVARAAISEGFLGCPRQCAAEQHAEQHAEGRTTGSWGGQSAGESVKAISIHGPIQSEIELTTQRVK